jgi:hypothetical protein
VNKTVSDFLMQFEIGETPTLDVHEDYSVFQLLNLYERELKQEKSKSKKSKNKKS